jgi:hypothetical protein
MSILLPKIEHIQIGHKKLSSQKCSNNFYYTIQKFKTISLYKTAELVSLGGKTQQLQY